MKNQDGYFLAAAASSRGKESSAGSQPGQCIPGPSQPIPRFRGVLLCRRCDACGTRIGIMGEAKDRVILKCPECQREYTFFERPE